VTWLKLVSTGGIELAPVTVGTGSGVSVGDADDTVGSCVIGNTGVSAGDVAVAILVGAGQVASTGVEPTGGVGLAVDVRFTGGVGLTVGFDTGTVGVTGNGVTGTLVEVLLPPGGVNVGGGLVG